MKIKDLIAREILDSRGNPTVEVELITDNDIDVIASVPSGASTGSREALELRDNDPLRYHGLGVEKAVSNVNTIIKNNLIGLEINQEEIDKNMILLDATDNKSYLGANAMLGVSLAVLKALAKNDNKDLYEYISSGTASLPIPMMNIVNGGKHADSGLEIQEFMIVPVVKTFKERLRAGSEVFHTLKKILKSKGESVAVGDEGGFAPHLPSIKDALDVIVEAIKKAGYVPGKDIFIALDCAASEFYNKDTNKYTIDKQEVDVKQLTDYYMDLINNYPIISIEDPYFEDDFDSLAKFTEEVGNKIMLVGDDYFVTNKKYLEMAISKKAGNAILLKANQIGTVTEMLDTIKLAKDNGYKTIISHRSGETEDTFIADLAVGLDLGFIKTGSLSRGERIAKYNRLLRIEEKLTK